MQKLRTRKDLLYVIAIFLLSALIFFLIVGLGVITDIQTHAQILADAASGTRVVPSNFLYYFTVYALSFFQNNMIIILGASALVLSVAVTIKFVLTRKILCEYFAGISQEVIQPNRLTTLVTLVSFLLIFVFSLPSTNILQGQLYIGQITPNVWHNSTLIFLMPFALLLFWTSYRQLVSPKNSRIWMISLLVIVNILIKPNFFWVFLVVYPLLLATRIGVGRKFLLNVLPIAILGVLLLSAQYYFLNIYPDAATAAESGIKISPFSVWSHYSSNIPLSIVVSSFFPLVYLCFHLKEVLKNLLLKYAVSLYLVAISIFSVLSETGPREFHGNFFWQCVACNYILFMVVCILFMEKAPFNSKMGKKEKVIVSSFLLHVAFGVLYLGKMFLSGNFL